MNGWAWQATSIAQQVGSSVTLVGNLLALVIFLWTKKLRVKYYAFVINLVIANLFHPIMLFIYQYYENDIFLALLRTALFVAELNLLAIAINLLLALSITPPSRCDFLMTSWCMFAACLLLWVISAAIYLPSTYVYNDVVIHLVRPLITITIFAVTSVLYYIVFRKISRYNPMSSTPAPQDADEVTSTRMIRTRRMMVTVTIILVSSLVCWLPFCCANFYIYFSGKYYGGQSEEFKIMFTAFLLLLMVNSLINPFIYWWRITEFRDGLKRLVCCQCLRRQDPDEGYPDVELYGADNLGSTVKYSI